MSDTTPVYYTVAAIAASSDKGGDPIPVKYKQAPPISVQKKRLEQREGVAQGKLYTFFKPSAKLRLDDDNDFKVEKGEERRQQSLKKAGVKVRDFAYGAHNVNVAESCKWIHTNKQRQEYNQVLKHHNLKEMPIHTPQQVQPGTVHSSRATTEVPTEKNSPVATRRSSPVHHSPELNAGDLAVALGAVDLVDDTDMDDVVASEVAMSNPSPMPGGVPAAKEKHITVDAGDASESSSSPAAQSISAAAPPHTPFHAATSALSLMVFGGSSPLTPLPVTPHISTLEITLKRKRSDTSIGRAANKDGLRRKVAMDPFDAARPKKTNRKVAEKAGSTSNGKTTKASRTSSRRQPTSSTTVVPTTPAAAAAPRVRPTASVRRRRAGVEDIACTPSKASKTSKKTAN